MATIYDEGDDNVENLAENEELANVSEEQVETASAPVEEAKPADDDIPDRYKNKDIKEIIRMHQEAEKALGRQGSEVGELRRVVDDYVKAQLVNKKQQAPEKIEDVDFFADPDQAVAKAIENHPKIKEAEQLSVQMRRQQIQAQLAATHPDFQQIIGSPEFVQWVTASPVRKELFARADANYDFAAADEILSGFKERKGVVNNAVAAEKANRSAQIKQASTGSAKGTGETSKKIFRRADIIELMRNDPERYEALQPEIMKAYEERRVR